MNPTRHGKVARLPRALRDELNRRLDDGESGETLLPWLNGLPEVQAVLTRHFGGVPVSKQNLHDWRTGGFAEWQARQEMLADARELAADAAEMQSATDGRLAEHLATVLAARYASTLAGWDGQPTEEFRQKLKILRSLCRDIAELRRGDHGRQRLQLEQDRVEEQREKTEAEVVAKFEQWAKQPAVQDWLCQTWVPLEERMRRKREMFNLPTEDDAAEGRPAAPKTDPTDPPADAMVTDVDDDEASTSIPDNATPAVRDPRPETRDPKGGSSPVKVSQGDDSMPVTGSGPSAPDAAHPTASPAVGRPGGA
jgi:hypothetical protein